MARFSAGVLQKLPKPARKIRSRHIKFPWRKRTRKQAVKLTAAEKNVLKENRNKKRTDLALALADAREAMWELAVGMHDQFHTHSPGYYYKLIMQQSRLKVKPRKISLWNAFVSMETKKYNDELGGAVRVKASGDPIIKDLSARWSTMSREEKEAACQDGVEELTERQQNRKQGVQNVPIASFHDADKTLAVLQRELQFLNERTGTELLLIAVRSSIDHYNPPMVFHTSERIPQFFSTISKRTLNELAMQLEGFCISGVQGLVRTHSDGVMQLKRRVKDLIFEKLQQACTRGRPLKMSYVNFEEKITAKYGVVLVNWPLQKFAAPGYFNSLPVLNILLNSWTNDATYFRSLNDEEWTKWEEARRAGSTPTGVSIAENAGTEETGGAPTDANAGGAPETTTGSGETRSTTSAEQPASEPRSPSTTPTDITSTTGTTSTAASGATATSGGRKRAAEVLQDNFINAVTAADGSGLHVPKRARKERSDKNKKRGPRKKKGAEGQENAEVPSA